MSTFKRVVSLVLALVLVLGMVPTLGTEARAAGTLSVTDAKVGLSWTDASSSSGKASWSANGNTVTGTATGYRAAFVIPRTITTTLTITNNHSEDRTLVFDYTLTGGGSVSGTISGTSGSYSATLAAGASTTITLTSPSGSSTNTLTLSGLQLLSSGNVTSTFLAPENGSYTVDGAAVTAQTTKEKAASESYVLAATPASGYMFFGWYSEATDSYVSYDASTTQIFGSDPQLKPVFIPSTTALFGVGTAKFADLTEACNYALTASTKTVVLLNNGTVSGSHTIPAGITLLVPFNSSNTLYTSEPACTSSIGNNVAWVKPTAYRTLTLAADANITVNGAISVSGKHAASNGGKPYSGAPTGPVGWVNMQSGSQITLNSGAKLYAWGFIQGAGTITAKNGSHVYENFQFTDFRGGSNLTQMITDGTVFPINQYYVQNIEVATTYEAGAKETLYTSAYASGLVLGGAAPFIGEGGMFVINSGYVVKDYIENRDRLKVDVYGDIDMSSMTVDVGQKVDSSTYILPITNNIVININSGTTTVKQSVALTPGVEMTIAQGAVLDIGYSATALNDYNTAGHNLIVYDRDEWFYGFNMETGEIVENTQYAFGSSITGMFPLPYAPGRTYNRTAANDLNDAVLNVNGTLVVNGFLYTTMGGGAIKSTGKTGTIVMQSGSGFDMFTFQANGGTSLGIMMNSAALMNGDGTYLNTITFDEDFNPVTYAEPGTTYNYCAAHDQWYTGECADCSVDYTVTFDANGAEMGSADPIIGNGTVTLPGMICYKTGYTQSGWNTQADGKGTHYDLGADYTISGNVTLYAEWTLNKNELTFSINNETATSEIAYGATVNEPDVTAPNGYHLAGWTDADDDVINFPFPMPDHELTVYAQFEQHDFAAEVAGSRVDATCSAAGSVTMKCECGETTTETLLIDSTNHTPGADADCKNAQTCTLCGTELKEALGHQWETPTYKWNEYTSCTATRECVRGCEESETADWNNYKLNSQETKKPNCITEGETTYTASFDADWAKDQTTTKTLSKNPSSHASAEYEYVSNDNGTHTKRHACCKIMIETADCSEGDVKDHKCDTCGYTVSTCSDSNDKDHNCDICGKNIESHTPGAAVEEDRVEASCGTDGSYNSVVYCTECGDKLSSTPNTIPATQKHVDGDDKNHDCDNCDATNIEDHTKGAPVQENVIGATCEVAGSYDEVVYCTECGAEISRENKAINVLGHAWGDPSYIWSADGKSYTAQRVCATDASHVETATAQITANQTKAPTCTEMGETTYTAVFTEEWAEGSTKTVADISATGHSYEAVVTPATCTAGGYTTYTCSVCGDSYTGNETEALGHDYEGVVTDPTCTEAGYTTYTCSVCDDSYTADEVAATGHDMQETAAAVAPGCESVGYTAVLTCANGCGKTEGGEEVAATGHDMQETTAAVAPGCESVGYTAVLTCANGCGKTEGGEEIAATGHDMQETTAAVAPGCETAGSTAIYTCDNGCGKTEGGEEIAATGHDMQETTAAVAPGCETAGSTAVYTCANGCGTTEGGEVIPATGHNYVVNEADWYEVDGFPYYGVVSVCENDPCHVEYDPIKDITWLTKDGVEGYYAFDHDTGKFLSDYTGIYTASNGDIYYVENGIAAPNKGLTRVITADGEVNYYYFGCGQASCKAEGCAEDVFTARKDCVHWSAIDNGLLVKWDYTFNNDGTIVHDDAYAIHESPEEPLHEIVTYDGVKYYTIDGVKVHYGLFMSGEDYYYARSSGALVAGCNYWITITNDLPIAEGSYAFDADGKMIVPKPEDPEEPETPKNGIYEEDGGLFYYVNGKRTYAGLISYTGVSETGVVYDNALIYVRTSGQLAVGSYWPTKTNDLMVTTRRHNFDANGIMTDPPVPEVPKEPKNGIYEEDGSLYYYENDVRTYAGLIKIDGNYYYVRTSGELAHSCAYWPTKTNGLMVTTRRYTFNEQGVMVDAPAELP